MENNVYGDNTTMNAQTYFYRAQFHFLHMSISVTPSESVPYRAAPLRRVDLFCRDMGLSST